MSDLTLIYYTCGRISQRFAEAVRHSLKCAALSEWEIIAVTHGPIELGDFCSRQIDVGLIAPSIYQVYVNALLAAKAATTSFVACCEDDTLYRTAHFRHRPALDCFAYDRSRWVLTRRLSADGKRREALFYWRERHQFAMAICPRELLIETLEEKFAKYPVPPPSTDIAKKAGWGEPGRYEKNLGLTRRKMEYFDSTEPSVTVNHSASLMGRRKVNTDDIITTDLKYWGNADELWKRIHG